MPFNPSDRERYREEVAAVLVAEKRDDFLRALEAYASEQAMQDGLCSGDTLGKYFEALKAAVAEVEGNFTAPWLWDAFERCGEMDARRKRERAEADDDDDA